MRYFGSTFSIFASRSIASWSTFWQAGLFRLNLIFRLFSQTSSNLRPSKSGFLTNSIWKITPAENTSQTGLAFCPLVRVVISGATQPGVPHLQKIQSSLQTQAASPKSTITGSRLFSFLSMMFSGLMSRCMMPLSWISFRPFTRPIMNCLISPRVNSPWRLLILLWSCPAVSSSSTTYSELSDSKTAYSLITWGESNSLIILISFSRVNLWLWFSERMVFCLEKALTAKWQRSVSLSTSQTVANPPLPNFLTGLQRRWKPSWLRQRVRYLIQMSTMLSFARMNSTGLASVLVRMKPTRLEVGDSSELGDC